MKASRLGVFSVAIFLMLSGIIAAYGTPNKPVYVGARVCGPCHEGPGIGSQFSLWMHSKHSRAWAVLSNPASKKIARISGILEPPQKAAICLGCHAPASQTEEWERDDTFYIEDGVQCENCHGPGSEYKSVMPDRKAALAAGLKVMTERDCLVCHIEKASHVNVLGLSTVDLKKGILEIAHAMPSIPIPPLIPAKIDTARPEFPKPVETVPEPIEPEYKTPLNLVLSPDGKELYVACEGAGTLIVIDTAQKKNMAEIPVGRKPADVAISADGRRVFVSNRFDDTVSVIDTVARKGVTTIKTGAEPHGMALDPAGKFLFVANAGSDDISVFDARSFQLLKTLSASRKPWGVALSPDGKEILVTHSLARLTPMRTPFASEVAVLDTVEATVKDRITVADANLMLSVAWDPKGAFALATLNRTKNLVPMTRLLQGWTITNGLGILWKDGSVNQILLDEPNMGFADPTAVAITPNGRLAFVTSATTNRVAVVDIDSLRNIFKKATPEERDHLLPNSLGTAADYVVKYIPTNASPRGIIISRDGTTAYVANALDDSVSVIDVGKLETTGTIDLGGSKMISKVRIGERLFHNAKITFHRQFSCHSCHPDGHVDGLTYDIEADGIGISPVDNRTLRGIVDTAPFKWEGTNPSLKRQCGARLAVFFTRVAPFTPDELSALDLYITTIPRPPNRFHPPGSAYTAAQRRGRAIFERTTTNDGREIPVLGRCVSCHPPPYFTDRQRHDVGTKHETDRQGRFDVPHLSNIYDSAPYLHNGMAATLEEIWTVHNPYDTHGVTNDMTKDQLNDLIEYVKTL